MKKIFKYQLVLTDVQTVNLPSTGTILSAQMQNGAICLWVLVTPDEKRSFRKIVIYGTGHDVDDVNLKFIDTVQDGNFVWHIFEKTGLLS